MHRLVAARDEAISWIHRLDPNVKVSLPGDDQEDVSKAHPSPYSWDGKGRLIATGGGLGVALHEVAHFLLADPERRKLPEYGLGPDPYRMYRPGSLFVVKVMTEMERDREENLTCYLQLGLMYVLGLSERVSVEAKKLGLAFGPLPEDIEDCRAYRGDCLPEEVWERILTSV